MKNYTLLLLLGFSIILSSCDKSIKGKIIDNFSQPVQGVKVTIKNSAFESISDPNGDFKIDFAAGKFIIEFQKQNYIAVTKELEITETKSYPLGKVEIIRIPCEKGLYFKGTNDFISIPKIKLNAEKVTRSAYGITAEIGLKYSLPSDNIFTIEIDSLKTVEFFDYLDISLLLTEANDKYFVENCKPDMFSPLSIWGKSVKEKNYKLVNGIEVHTFNPELGKKYVYIDYIYDYLSQRITNTAYAFKFIKKQ